MSLSIHLVLVLSIELFRHAKPNQERLESMKTVEIEIDPKDPSTFPKGSIDYKMVDATTEADIDRHIAEDLEEERQEMARFIRQLRGRMNLSRREFARRLRISPNTVRHWEEGKRFPSGTACSLLRVLDKEPDTVLRVLA
ncbi:MAG: helix-turn-helix domain-containing protein [Rhodobacteraceae bacterium]|nr:helix-turn-helix domain-containing protein [Paracoccaceae bacterium]